MPGMPKTLLLLLLLASVGGRVSAEDECTLKKVRISLVCKNHENGLRLCVLFLNPSKPCHGMYLKPSSSSNIIPPPLLCQHLRTILFSRFPVIIFFFWFCLFPLSIFSNTISMCEHVCVSLLARVTYTFHLIKKRLVRKEEKKRRLSGI